MNLRPVSRVDRRYQPPPGGAVVGMNYVTALAAAARRGGGSAGSRGYYPATVGQGVRARVIPLVLTPATGVYRSQLGGWPVSRKIGHGMAGMGEQITLESWGKARAEKDMGGAVVSMNLAQKLSKAGCTSGSTFGFKDSMLWVDKGCRGVFDVTLASGVGDEGARLKAAKDVLDQFERQLRSGAINPDAALPTGTAALGNPTNPANQSIYADIVVLRDTLIPSARDVGRMYWSLRNGVVSGPGATTTVPAGTTTPVPVPVSAVTPAPYGSSGAFSTNIPNDLYGGGVDPVTGTPSSPQAPGPTTTVQAPVATAEARRRVSPGVAIAVGVAVVGAIAFAISRRSKARR